MGVRLPPGSLLLPVYIWANAGPLLLDKNPAKTGSRLCCCLTLRHVSGTPFAAVAFTPTVDAVVFLFVFSSFRHSVTQLPDVVY